MLSYPAICVISVLFIIALVVGLFLIIRCLMQGRKCPSRHRLDGKVNLY